MSRKPDVTLLQLRYFVEAATCLSMTRAAHRLLIAQSAVSAAVAQLENQVGAQLFVRQRARGLVLTPAGEQLLGDARALLTDLDQALDAARGMDDQVRGTIRIACFVTVAPFVLSEVLGLLEDVHPHLDVEAVEVDADGAHEALRSGQVELVMSYDFGYPAGVRRETVATVAPHVVLPAGHPLARRPRIPLRELTQDRLILLDLPHSREYFLGILASAGVDPVIRHRSYGYETVRSLVAKGHGYSILNMRPRHDQTYDGRSVVTRAIADDVPALPFVIASSASVRTTARARAVSDAVRTVVRDLLAPQV